MRSKTVLLVEDETPKRNRLLRYLETSVPLVKVIEARSVNSALDAIEANNPDLILLDMSLPTFDVGAQESGGRPQGFGGAEILRQMTLAGISCPTIVITGYEAIPNSAGQLVDLAQMREDLEREFPDLFRGILHYNSTFDKWEVELLETLKRFGLAGEDV